MAKKHEKVVNIFRSRYGDERIVKNEGGGCYTVEGESRFYRVSGDEKTISMFDFQGGPALFVGEAFDYDPSNPDAVIESMIVEKPTKENWAKVSIVVR